MSELDWSDIKTHRGVWDVMCGGLLVTININNTQCSLYHDGELVKRLQEPEAIVHLAANAVGATFIGYRESVDAERRTVMGNLDDPGFPDEQERAEMEAVEAEEDGAGEVNSD